MFSLFKYICVYCVGWKRARLLGVFNFNGSCDIRKIQFDQMTNGCDFYVWRCFWNQFCSSEKMFLKILKSSTFKIDFGLNTG